MKFYTNKISTGKSVDFGEFVTKLANSNANIKTASTEAVTKEANAANFGDKKAPPFGAKKDEKEGGDDVAKAKDEGKEKEACGTDCDASSEKEVKVAEKGECKEKDGECHVKMQEMDPVGGTNTGKPEGDKKKKESEAKADVKEAGKKAPEVVTKKIDPKDIKGKPVKKADNSEIPADNKGRTHGPDECCGAPSSKGDDGSEGEKKAEKSEKSDKEASSKKYVKIANLDSKTKNEWKTYWKKLYPSDYVDAMFADK